MTPQAAIYAQQALFPEINPWERQPDEPARWYMRFRCYLAMGRKRSVNGVFEAERQEKAGKRTNKAGETWYGAARRYQWEMRANAWDAHQDESKAQTARDIAARCPFVSRPYRIVSLNNMALALEHTLASQDLPALNYLAISKHLQALMQEIAQEVTSWQSEMETISDAAALDAMHDLKRRIEERAREREEEEEAKTDALIERAMLLEAEKKRMQEFREQYMV